jgi:hypothetical protein
MLTSFWARCAVSCILTVSLQISSLINIHTCEHFEAILNGSFRQAGEVRCTIAVTHDMPLIIAGVGPHFSSYKFGNT